MRHRRSRLRQFLLSVAVATLAPSAALAQPVDLTASANAPTTTTAAPAAADDRLTQLARELAGETAEAAPASEPAVGDQRPLGGGAGFSSPGQPASPQAGGSGTLGALGALGLVIALVLGLRWAWIRFGGGVVARSSPAVEVLSRTTVAPRNHVILLRVGGRILVVGDSAAGLRTLTQIDDADEVASLLEAVTTAKATSISQGFSQLLANRSQEFESEGAEVSGGAELRVDRVRDSLSGLAARVRMLSQRGGSS